MTERDIPPELLRAVMRALVVYLRGDTDHIIIRRGESQHHVTGADQVQHDPVPIDA